MQKKDRQRPARIVVPLQLKAAEDGSRTFEGLAATWSQDLGNDVIHKGAFKKSIQEWKSSDVALPLLNSHDHFNIMAALGQAQDMAETKDGLWTKWEVLDGPEGDAVLNRLRPSKVTKRPIIGKMSIGYLPIKFDFEQPEGTKDFWDRVRHLHEVKLEEVSLVLFPMNPGATIDASTVKSMLLDLDQLDPSQLNMMTRKSLRKLSARIGNLLKKNDPNPTTPTAQPSTPASVTPPTNGSSADDDDSDETEGKTVEPPKTPVASEDAGDKTDEDVVADVVTEPEEVEDGAVKVYAYPDALAQKIQAVTLKHRVAGVGSK